MQKIRSGIVGGKKIRGLEGKLFNNSNIGEISQQPQIDTSLSPYCPIALLPFFKEVPCPL